jgi:dihydroflavonol-4-reductase
MSEQEPKRRRQPKAVPKRAAPDPTSAPKPARRRSPARRTGPAEPATPAPAEPAAVEPAAEPAPAAEAAPSAAPATAAEPAPSARRRRVFVTGATGFIGRRVVVRLLDRGDEVIAAVRDPSRATDLSEEGATVVADDLSNVGRLAENMHEVDAAIHLAGSYRVGIPRDERGAMWDANVGTTTRFLDAAEAARVPRLVYVSTVNVFGNTRGRVVDETYRRDLGEGFLSWYDETKFGAHEVAEQRLRAGAPLVIVLPSQVYGRRDRSSFGEQLRRASAGDLRYRALDEVGVGLVHVDDLADGIVAALDRGVVGESYVLSGPTTRLRDAVDLAARAGGRRAARIRLPSRALRLLAPLGRLIGQPNLRELVSASAGVTYWASSEKAERELGFRPRDLETGFADTFGGRRAP